LLKKYFDYEKDIFFKKKLILAFSLIFKAILEFIKRLTY